MMPTNPTPGEISRLERAIAERVMGWESPIADQMLQRFDWSPWHNVADALEVLEKLADGGSYEIWYHSEPEEFHVIARNLRMVAIAPGPHFGPAVCMLAEKILNK